MEAGVFNFHASHDRSVGNVTRCTSPVLIHMTILLVPCQVQAIELLGIFAPWRQTQAIKDRTPPRGRSLHSTGSFEGGAAAALATLRVGHGIAAAMGGLLAAMCAADPNGVPKALSTPRRTAHADQSSV